MNIFILGSTGLVGSQILLSAIKSPKIQTIKTIGRRAPKTEDVKIKSIQEADSEKWGEIIEKEATDTSAFLSAFGTTHAQAGSKENFVKIDYGVNYQAAKAAKEAGVKTFVLISSAGASSSSWINYSKTKGRLEDDIIKLNFDKTIILRPGVLLGDREVSRTGEGMAQTVGKFLYNSPLYFVTFGVYAEDLGKLALSLAEKGVQGEKVEIIGPNHILKLVCQQRKESS